MNNRGVLPTIILIGGTPGVGKTTVAKRVAESIGGKYINVAELAVGEGLVVSYDAERGAYIIDDARVRERLRQVARERLIIVDTHVASAVPQEELYVAVILRLDPRELEVRLRSRGYPKWKVLENVQAEVLDACLVEAVEL
ncbi:MAG: adenylate kinase family protein, partial [Thermofilaceae archaeon]